MRKRRLLAVSLLLVAFGAITGGATAATATGGPIDFNWARQSDQLVVIEQFRAIAEATPDTFAGVSTRGSGDVTVHVVNRPGQPGPDLDAIRRAAAADGIKLTVTPEKHSLTDLNRVQTAVQNDRALGAGRVGAVIDPATNQVRITAPAVTPELTTAVGKQFGDAVHVTQRVQGRRSSGRFNDSAPFYGGVRIANPANWCTFGFSLTNKFGTEYAVTAGHCFANGAGVSATRWFPGTDSTGTGYADFGKVQFQRGHNDFDLDNELIGNGAFDGRAWVDANLRADPAQHLPVHDARDSCGGCLVFSNGSVAGRRLLMVEEYLGCDDHFGDGIISCGLWVASIADGGPQPCGRGDSGGSVFSYDGNGGITAVGIITGYVGDYCIFTSMPEILRSWQSTITTG